MSSADDFAEVLKRLPPDVAAQFQAVHDGSEVNAKVVAPAAAPVVTARASSQPSAEFTAALQGMAPDIAKQFMAMRDGTETNTAGNSYDSLGNGQIVPTGSPAAKAAQSPLSGMSGFQAALAGTGKLLSDMYTGSQQAGSKILSGIPGFAAVNTQANQDAQNARQNDAPLMATGAGKVGYISGGLPLSAVPGANTVTGAALLGSGLGAMTPTVGDESRLQNTALGGVLGIGGKALGDTLGNFVRPGATRVASGLTGAQQSALAGGQAIGMRVTPGQQTGSTALQQLEARLESQPWSSGPFSALKSGNQQALGSAVAQGIGETGSSLDATVLGNAADRLGKVFESVRNPNKTITVNPTDTKTAIDSIDQEVKGLLPGNASVRDNPLVSDLETMTSSGSINAKQLGQLSSKLGKAAYKQMSSPAGDRDWGQALYGVKDHVDDLVQKSLTAPEAAKYGAARGQYRNLMTLTSRNNIVNPSTGEVSGTALASKLQQADKSGFLYGNNQTPMYQAARFAQAFKPIVGNSGTATRTPNITSLTELPLGLASNLISRAYLSRPGSAAMRGLLQGAQTVPQLGGLLGNRFPQLQGLLQSPANAGTGAMLLPYLSQQ